MLPFFVLGIALFVGGYLLVRAFADADPRILARGLRWFLIIIGVVALIVMTVTGRLGLAVAVAAFLFPLVARWRTVVNRLKAAAGPAQGQTSSIRTRFLHMHLDHDTGAMWGEVVQGPHAGRNLDQLSTEDILDLLDACRSADAQSVAVLEAYLDRNRPDWRGTGAGSGAGAGPEQGTAGGGAGGGGGGGRGGSSAMTREEAYEILGVEPGAPPEAIKEAHRRLMLKIHPDQGGSTYLAAKINQAKDILLGS
ncbi:DnaJ domain-containing protein [Arenibaculum sp.]|uniref:DnaJ domain-containing protein n=1 Tax=Arenibaculum sp. TaxID=2865862 RepID=UPI002E0E5D15|nr:DnaJ domain-containing protein [Arenibaculum sp.]